MLVFFTNCYSDYQVKNEMREACSTNGGGESAIQGFGVEVCAKETS
jgi:hypothetical protein